jgi:hypothetical protein
MSRFIRDCRRGSDRWVDLLISCIRHSELQVITSLLLISALYKSLQHSLRYFPVSCVFNSHPLATASNSGDSSASRSHIVAFWQISSNWTLVSSQLWTHLLGHLSSAFFTELDWTTNFQLNSPTHQPITSLHFTQLKCTQPAWEARYTASGRTQQKTLFSYCCSRVRFRGNVITESLLRKGLHNPVDLSLRECTLRPFSSNGRCLHNHRLATGLYAATQLSHHFTSALKPATQKFLTVVSTTSACPFQPFHQRNVCHQGGF